MRRYTRKKLDKTAPDSPGKVLFERRELGYLVHWKFKTKKPPQPKRWANIVVFLMDPNARKRSFQTAWNGRALARSADLDRLNDEHPDIVLDLYDLLPVHNERLVKPLRNEDEDEGYDD